MVLNLDQFLFYFFWFLELMGLTISIGFEFKDGFEF